ncbi:MAG: GrpB family protein [Candidatus Parcubacteria bacterium]|nr:GrpB family protein [Candidatus Parcubacteria bacterium]
MIGLKRGIVKLTPHQKQWGIYFIKEKKRLQKSLGQKVIAIEHIGSTAIKNISAKPIIDIAVGIKKLKDGRQLIRSLEKLGYHYRPLAGLKNQRLFFAKGPESNRTHYLHLVKYNGQTWKKHLFFRDKLNSNKKIAKQYSALKKQLAKKFSQDRQSYTAKKHGFIQSVLKNGKLK